MKQQAKNTRFVKSQKLLQRVRRICMALPETTEKLSHGEPTFFVRKRVFCMFANNHHNDGRIAVWLPAPCGIQEMLITASAQKYFKPPYVGVRGWSGVVLHRVNTAELEFHVRQAWRMIAPAKLHVVLAQAGTKGKDQHCTRFFGSKGGGIK